MDISTYNHFNYTVCVKLFSEIASHFTFRHVYLGSFLLDPEDTKILSLGVI